MRFVADTRPRRTTALRTLIVASVVSSALAVSAQAQSARPLWTRDSIHSTVLGETRFVRIALPPNYGEGDFSADRYPVLIVLDAESDVAFNAMVGNAQALGGFGPAAIPRVIVVGVEVPDLSRVRDLMPPATTQAVNGGRPSGAPAFLRFISSELLPHIAGQFRTLPVVIIAGHSLGGLFAAWALGREPDVFRGAIALSPSVPLGDGVAGNEVLDALKNRVTPGRLFMLASATESFGMDSAVKSFASKLNGQLPKGLTFEYQRISGASHDQTTLFGIIPSLQFIFRPVSLSGYRVAYLNSVDAPEDSIVAAFDSLRNQYHRGAADMGMPQYLPFYFLMNQSRSRRSAVFALHVCQDLKASYPDVWNGYACAGDAEAKLSRNADAAANYRQASEVARRAGNVAVADSLAHKANNVRAPN